MTARYLGPRQQQVLRLLAEENRERTATQLAGPRGSHNAYLSLLTLVNRDLVSVRQGWAGRMFTITPAGPRSARRSNWSSRPSRSLRSRNCDRRQPTQRHTVTQLRRRQLDGIKEER